MNSLAERTQVMELVKTLPDDQINYVLHIILSLPRQQQPSPSCTLRGRFANYANSELRATEKEAWGLAAEEKHGLR